MTSTSKSQTEHQHDDLTAIKGIKAARQQWFRETFNVHTFSDLAALSIDEIETRLKAEKQIPSRSKIEGWLAEAQYFAENPTVIANLKNSDTHKDEGWKPFASFVVEFQEREVDGQLIQQTLVHHVEADKTHTWPHVEQHELCTWVIGQLGNHNHLVSTAPHEETKNEPSITDVQSSYIFPTIPTQANTSGFSPRLQQLLQRGNTLSRRPEQSKIKIAAPVQKPSYVQPDSNVPSQIGFSEGLQRALDKAQRLSTKK
jgi:hypothetical protein